MSHVSFFNVNVFFCTTSNKNAPILNVTKFYCIKAIHKNINIYIGFIS